MINCAGLCCIFYLLDFAEQQITKHTQMTEKYIFKKKQKSDIHNLFRYKIDKQSIYFPQF